MAAPGVFWKGFQIFFLKDFSAQELPPGADVTLRTFVHVALLDLEIALLKARRPSSQDNLSCPLLIPPSTCYRAFAPFGPLGWGKGTWAWL